MTSWLIAQGCVSNPGGYVNAESVEKRLLGMPSGEIVAKLGTPLEFPLENEIPTWTYRDNASGLGGGSCVITLKIENGRVASARVEKTDISPLSFPMGSCRNLLGKFD